MCAVGKLLNLLKLCSNLVFYYYYFNPSIVSFLLPTQSGQNSPIRRNSTTLNMDSRVGMTTPKNVDSFRCCRCGPPGLVRGLPGRRSGAWPAEGDRGSDSFTLVQSRQWRRGVRSVMLVWSISCRTCASPAGLLHLYHPLILIILLI